MQTKTVLEEYQLHLHSVTFWNTCIVTQFFSAFTRMFYTRNKAPRLWMPFI